MKRIVQAAALSLFCLFLLHAMETLLWAQGGFRPWRPFPPELGELPPLGPPPRQWAPIPPPAPEKWSVFSGQSELPAQNFPPLRDRAWPGFSNFRNTPAQPYRPVPPPRPEVFAPTRPLGEMPDVTFPPLPPERPWSWRPYAPFAPMPAN